MTKLKQTIIISAFSFAILALLLTMFLIVRHGWIGHHRIAGPPKPHTQVQVAPATFDHYLGKFELIGENEVMTITRDGNHLFEQITDRPRREIFPESDEKFFFKDIDAEITFKKDAQGQVNALVLDQFEDKFNGKRIQ